MSGKTDRSAGERSPLLREDWAYVEKFDMDDFRREDWSLMNRQRDEYLRDQRYRQVLDLLKASRNAPTFGYAINNYEHCLQTATMLHRDDFDDESVVAGLLHDIGFIVCPDDHGKLAADLLRSILPEKQIWMLEHHEIFQRIYLHEYGGDDDAEFVNAREQWRGHEFFDWTEAFVRDYDIVAINPDFETLPIEFFEPIVKQVFDRAMDVA